MNKRPDYLNMKSDQHNHSANHTPSQEYAAEYREILNVDGQKVLRNTYMLLSLTLLFSSAVVALSIMFDWPHPGLILTLVGYFGLLFFVEKTKNSAMGLVAVFALTGFMGLTLGRSEERRVGKECRSRW